MNFNDILVFLKLIDQNDNTLSLTTLSLYIALFKLALSPTTSFVEVSGFLIAAGLYQGKKLINGMSKPDVTEELNIKLTEVSNVLNKVEELQSEVTRLNLKVK